MCFSLKTILHICRSGWLIFALRAFVGPLACKGDVENDFHKIQQELDDALLDAYADTPTPTSAGAVTQVLSELKPYLQDPEAVKLLQIDPAELSTAAQIGQARARLEQVAALEMIRCQESGDLAQAFSMEDADRAASIRE